jgi:hypothetical protein
MCDPKNNKRKQSGCAGNEPQRGTAMIPKPVYEFLPYFYVSVGIVAMLFLDSIMSFVSGLLMSVTGVLILWLRRNHRQSQLLIEEEWQPE